MAIKRTQFAEGYQAALVDISRAIREGGVDRAAEWISDNLHTDTRRAIEMEIVTAMEGTHKTMVDGFVIVSTYHLNCGKCAECADKAASLARAMGNVAGSHSEGEHGATVRREN